jgi:uroporphyrinogen-III synthase
MTAGSPSRLAGLRVVVTRSVHQADGLIAAFAAAGARVETLPLLEVVPPAEPGPLRRAASELARYDWLVFTSANAVSAFLPLASPLGAAPWPPRLQVAAVGDATAAALRAYGVEPQLPLAAKAAGLIALLVPRLRPGAKVLLPQAADAGPLLKHGLAATGAEAVTVVAYEKRLPEAAPHRAAELFGNSPLGWVSFTSPRIVRHFVGLFGEAWRHRRSELAAATIGGVTSAELRRHGVEPSAMAAQPSDVALVEAVIKALTK